MATGDKRNTNLMADPLIIQETSKYELCRLPSSTMILLGIIVVLPCILGGMELSYSAVALPQMHLNVDDASWYAAVPGFASPIGTLLLAIIIDVFGRRKILLVNVIPHFIGWLMISAEISFSVDILGRLMTGITTGILFYPAQVYAAECLTLNHSPRMRNNFATWAGISNAIGIIFLFFASCYLNYIIIASIAAIFSIVIFILIYAFIPESPAWLLSKGRIGDAEISQRKLGICQPILKKSRENISVSIATEGMKFEWSCFQHGISKLMRKDVYKPLLIMTVILILSISTGGCVILPYFVDIIDIHRTNSNNSSSGTASPSTITFEFGVVSGICILAARILLFIVLPCYSAKKIIAWSCVGSSLGMMVIGHNFLNSEYSSISYTLHVMAVWLVIFVFNFGVLSTPYAIMSDVFPSDAKGFASIPIITCLITGAIVIKIHPYLFLYYEGWVYFGYAACGVLMAIFTVFYIPEVSNKTVEEISEQFFSR